MGKSKSEVDPYVKSLIERCAHSSHRSLIFLRGEDVAEQVVRLQHLVYKANKYNAQQLPVLWCHKEGAHLAKSDKKTLESIWTKRKSGITKQLQPLDLLISNTAVRFCSYNDVHHTTDHRHGMCVLQDMDCLTPNLLCCVVETVLGGGSVVLLLPDASHLRQFRDLDMEVHSLLTSHSHPMAMKLFNNRLLLSLAWCSTAVVLDSGLQLCQDVEGLQYRFTDQSSKELHLQDEQNELMTLQQTLADAVKPLPQLLNLCKTLDQGKALTKLLDVITERRPSDVVSLMAGRGRGKSAVLGLAVAAAVDLGLVNIFVTSHSPRNLSSFFQFLFAGFNALEYKLNTDYEVFKSTNPDPEFLGTIVRVVVFRNQRQNVQFLLPEDHTKLQHAELLVVDEAAAISLPQVEALLGPHITLMASTTSGYEATGRGLTLKLLKMLRQPSGVRAEKPGVSSCTGQVNELHEVTLNSSVMYASDDPVENWLNRLLCLGVPSNPVTYLPAPVCCSLYYVNKRVLLSGNKWSEQLLAQMQSLLVSSRARNSPDDLQVMADAPAHHLFVLLPTTAALNIKNLPPVLCVLQVCMEGGIPASEQRQFLLCKDEPHGDLVPWKLAVQYEDAGLSQHVGARVVRAAAHPDYLGMGYGSRALTQLEDYYSGRLLHLEDIATDAPQEQELWSPDDQGPIGPQQIQGSLLRSLTQHLPPAVDYLSAVFGITPLLYKFWARAGFLPLHVSHDVNPTTGEHSCTMVYPVRDDSSAPLPAWLARPCQQFLTRFMPALPGPFRDLHPALALDIVEAHNDSIPTPARASWQKVELDISGLNLRRLEAFSKRNADRHLVTAIVPDIAHIYFSRQLPDLSLSRLQAALLAGSGLQHKELVSVGAELQLNAESTLGNFGRIIRRAYHVLSALQMEEYSSKLAVVAPNLLAPVDITVNQDLARLAKETEEERPDLHFHKKKQHDAESYNQRNVNKRKKRKYT